MTTETETPGGVDQATLDALREGIRGVLAEQCDSTALHAFIDGKTTLDRDIWAQAGGLGWLGFGIPEAHGGLGLGNHGLALLQAEIGHHAAPGPFLATLSAAQAIAETADTATQAAWLPRIAAGSISIAVPARLDGAALTRNGAGVSGTLRCLGNQDAGLLLVPAGDAWVLLEPPSGAIAPFATWDRTRQLIDVTLSGATPVAVLPDAAATRASLFRALALGIAADTAGAARSITDRTIAYMKTREQFGQPIAGFQALKHRAADLATRLAVMDEMVGHAALRIGAGEPDAEAWVALAKAEVTESAVFVTTDCVQLHGGVGFTWDFDPHIFLKRVRLNEVLLMANPALRDLAADRLAEVTLAGVSVLELGL